MVRALISCAGLFSAASLVGCAACGDGGGPDHRRAVQLRVTHKVTDKAPGNSPAYAVDDRTCGGAVAGDTVGLRREIVVAPKTAYRARGRFSHQGISGETFRYIALVAPEPPLKDPPETASAYFDEGSLTLIVDRGWGYVSGDMPVTDTGVVNTSTLGSFATGEWIARVLPRDAGYMVYNVGKGDVSTLKITVEGNPNEYRLPPGSVFTYPRPSGPSKIEVYNAGEEFLVRVKAIAAEAGITISP